MLMKNLNVLSKKIRLWFHRRILNYSVLSAVTGSFLAALRDGIIPAMSVKQILIATSIIAAPIGNIAFKVSIPLILWSIKLIGMHNR